MPRFYPPPRRATLGYQLRAACLALIVGSGALNAQVVPTDLSGNGAYDRVQIAGFLIPIRDLAPLARGRVLGFNAASGRFAFDARITSEHALKRATRPLPLQDPRALRDLYRAAKVALPNGVSHTLTVPSGYGPLRFANRPGRAALSLGVGGVSRVPHSTDPDGGAALVLSFGNAFEAVGATVGVSVNDLSDVGNTRRMALNVALSRYVGDGLSLAVGGQNLLTRDTDGQESYYFVASWAFDAQGSPLLPFDGVATLGAGSGRFADMSAADIAAGKSRDATVIFGALAWELGRDVTLITDWNGRNLSVGGAFRVPGTGVSLRLGLRDLTSRSGDGVRVTGSMGITLLRF